MTALETMPDLMHPASVKTPPPEAQHTLREDHIDSFDDFCAHLNQAAKSVLPNLSRRYSKVYALLLRWEDDDLGTESEIRALEDLLKDVYHYDTEKYLIPSSDSTAQLEYRLNDFRKAYDNGTNLLIVYYGGHGCLDKSINQPSRSIWQAKQLGGSFLVWSDLQGIMERAKSDVVFILDCCYAATASRSSGSKEGLWACNSEVTTTGVNDNSFTRNLIEEMRSLKASRFNVAMLHARLMRRYQRPGPHMLLTEPWYSYLGDIASHSAEFVPQLPIQQNGIDPPICIDTMMTETLVLLAVRLKETDRVPRLSSWQDWLHKNAPPEIDCIHALGRLQTRELVRLEAHFVSNSALILVSMPVFLWDRFPRHGGYSLVGSVKSPNALLPMWNPQGDNFINSSFVEGDWARVKTVDSSSEVEQELWSEVEEQLEHGIAVDPDHLWEAHYGTHKSTTNLALARWNQGKWSEAEDLQASLMRRLSRLLGEDHPSTLASMNNLALMYGNQGRWYEAVELLEKLATATRKELGEEHPKALSVTANLAMSYQKIGHWDKAEILQVKVLRTRMKILGQEHPDTLASMDSLTSTYHSQGRSDFALVEAIAPERMETPPSPSSNVPFRRDRDFVERSTLTDHIRAKLTKPAGRVALVGLGGVGKSQLAIEYAWALRQRSPQTWVLWMHASNAARFEQSVRDAADMLKIPGREDPKANILQLLQDWLRDERKGNWMIVLDNVNDASFFLEQLESQPSRRRIDYIPFCEHGSVLITTRSKSEALKLVYENDIVSVLPMCEEEAEALLVRKLGRKSLDDRLLVQSLDFMPLAITQATAYIRERGLRCSVRQYREEIERSRVSRTSLLRRNIPSPSRDAEAINAVMLTWQISFEYVYQTQRSAADLLSLMSFCDRLAIPEVLLRIDASETDYSISSSTFEDDIVTLRSFSFVAETSDSQVWEMHRLVQDATQLWLEERGRFDEVLSRFVHRIYAVFPTGRFENWSLCRTLFPHALNVAEYRPTSDKAQIELASVMYNAAWFAQEQGDYDIALRLALSSTAVRSGQLGEEDEMTLQSLAVVASTYWSQGRWMEAEELLVKVIEARLRVLGEEHPDTLSAMGNLASTYRSQGRWMEAEELLMKVVEAKSRMLGEEHPDMLSAMDNLASTYWSQGRWMEAEVLLVKVTEAMSRTLGEEHPDTLSAMGNLASTYRNQGRWKEAEELLVKVIEAMSRTLGEEHPDTLSAMGNLASTYRSQGQWKEAEELLVKVTEAMSRTLGEEHPDMLSAMDNLASTYWNQGRWLEAEELLVKVIEAKSRMLGEEHPDTLSAMGNLASTYRNQGRWKEAEELLVKVTEAMSRTLGEEHPDTRSAMGNLASTYRSQGRWKEAEELLVKVTEAMSRTLGEEHPDTLSAMDNLASTYWNQGRWMEAEVLLVKVTEAMSRTLGEEHPDTLSAIDNLASTYRNQGRWKEAEELLVKVTEAMSRTLGNEHPFTLTTMANLAAIYRDQGRLKEAEQLDVTVIEISQAKLWANNPSTLSRIKDNSWKLKHYKRW